MLTVPMAAPPVSADQGLSRDPGFGIGGRVIVDDALATSGFHFLTAQTDGRILVGEAGTNGTFVRRYQSDGSVDASFGADGDIMLPPSMVAAWLPQDPSQPIFVVLATATEGAFLLRRYEPDGSINTTYGSDGEVEFTNPFGYGSNVSIVADASGRVTLSSGNHAFAADTTRLHQFDPTGTPEPTFGVDGVATIDDTLGDVAGVDGAGRLLLTALWHQSFLPSIVRVTANGELDTSYGAGGSASLTGNNDITRLLVMPDGAAVAATRNYFAGEDVISVQRLAADGSTDLAFGTGGAVSVPFLDLQPNIGNTAEFAVPLSVQALSGGRIAVLANSFGASAALVLHADGSFDSTFGLGGRAILSVRLAMLAGSVEPSGAIDFLGFDAFTPIIMQRSIPGSPWPPIAPPPHNFVATESEPGTITATWSAVVNPDPEVTDYGYYFEISPIAGLGGTYRHFTESTHDGLKAPSLFQPGTYTVTVRSVNMYTEGLPATTTVTIPPPTETPDPETPYPPSTASSFVSLTPARLMDTRAHQSTVDGQFNGNGAPPAGVITELDINGRGGITANPSAVALNVTVTEPANAGYLTVYPCGIAPPNASNINFAPGQTIANTVLAKPGSNGKICFYSNTATHLIADVNGYYPHPT